MDISTGPIFVGLSGPAGAGKTTTGNLVAPPVVTYLDPDAAPPAQFRHVALAKPIYEMVTTKRVIKGTDRESRILYELHDTLNTLMARSIDYNDLVELVFDVFAMDAGTEDDAKPRTFMQTVGDMCRAGYQDSFVDYLIRRAQIDWGMENSEAEDELGPYFVIVSDVRYLNEVERMRDTGNFVLIRLEASRAVLDQRILDRDGRVMTDEEWDHPTETQAKDFPDEWFDLVLDTDTLDPTEQALTVKNFLLEAVGLPKLELAQRN